jgi:hypothetical protein
MAKMIRIILVSFALLLLAPTEGKCWSVTSSSPVAARNTANIPYWWLYPDGHLSALPSGNATYPWMMFWPEFNSYRTLGTGPSPEAQKVLSPSGPVFGGESSLNRWDNGGSWLASVHRLPNGNLVGFYHAEDHWYPHQTGEFGNNIAWKSMAVAYSSDNGATWGAGRQFLTSDKAKPATPAWGGLGDGVIVRDEANKRWVAFFQWDWIYMAISTDARGRAGTWWKYYEGQFSEPGLGGKVSPVPILAERPGANPSVHWNTFLNRWVMVWHGWDGNLYISASPDLFAWDQPQVLMAPAAGRRLTYATVIGVDDKKASSAPTMFYADMSEDWSDRRMMKTRLSFSK